MAGKEKKKGSEVPGWVVTFADLMSILVCFFILLLSFSIMDVKKFHEVSGSMKDAFGIQKERLLSHIVELIGSPVMEYASNVQPVPIPTLSAPNNDTSGASDGNDEGEFSDIEERIEEQDFDSNAGFEDQPGTQEFKSELTESDLGAMALAALRDAVRAQEQASADLDQTLGLIQMALQREMEGRLIDIEKNYSEIVITFPDEVGFRTGSEQITDTFFTALNRLSDVLRRVDGQVIVAGHTDSSPIRAGRFRNNWDLSAARAVSVVNHFKDVNRIDARRLEAHAFGESRPVDTNSTTAGRDRNRRVEIILRKAGDSTAPQVGQRVGGAQPPPPVPIYPPNLLRALRR